MSFTTFSVTMEDMKTEGLHVPWQGYKNPLPMPTLLPASYDIPPPAVSHLLYHNPVSRTIYPPPPHQNHHDPSSRQHKDTPAATSRPPLTSHQSYPSLKRQYQEFEAHATYLEPSQEPSQELSFDGLADAENPSKPSINPDHRLLSFAQAPDRHTLLDQYGRPGTVEIAAQIHGMFFLSEITTNASENNIIIQPELTCYRRNLFQISGSVTRPSGPISVVTDRGQSAALVSQELTISATESVDGHVVRLIVIPWKTPPPGSSEVPPNHEQEPPSLPLLPTNEGGPEAHGELMTYPIAWRRLQFRIATANNGRRKELQQHFVLRLALMATLANGTKFCISEATTSPIVVRGRSPRNFQARKEIPLVGSSASPRGQTVSVPLVDKRPATVNKVPPSRPGGLELPKRPFQFDTSSFPPSPALLRQGYSHWNTSQQPAKQTAITTTPTYPPSQPPSAAYVPAQQNQSSTDTRIHTPPVLKSQVPIIDAASGHRSYYNSNSRPQSSDLSIQFVDNNPRPLKSPRHTSTPDQSVPLYTSFENRIAHTYATATQNGESQSVREYFPVSMPESNWTSASNATAMYAASTSMPPPPPQQSHYTFPTDGYVKEEPPQQHQHQSQSQQYTWSAS